MLPAENERTEIRSLFPLIQAERSHIICALRAVSGNGREIRSYKILFSLNIGQERTDIIRYHLICWMFPGKKEDEILISLDRRKSADYLN
jgi:hypothetical protein